MRQEPTRSKTVTLPRFQRQMVDWLDLNTSHPVFMLIEVDVTAARQHIRELRNRYGRTLSLTAYLTCCFATAIKEYPLLHAFKRGRRRIVIFDDVDVALAIEHDLEGAKIPLPAIIRSAQDLTPFDVDTQVRAAQDGTLPQAWAEPWLGPWLILPRFIRRFILHRLLANPYRRKRMTGTTMVSAAGMFGRGSGWGISPPSYTISLLTGSLSKKPTVVEDDIRIREIQGMTVCFDHDIVDGAVAARFAQRLKDIVEDCDSLKALLEQDAPADTATPARSGIEAAAR